MDQLAIQFSTTEHVPPFFSDKDNVAAIFSLLLPGGGSFYKGNRITGWSFYFSEMITAGFGIYNYKESSGKYYFYALGAIKIIDIIYAYLAKPSYAFYNFENERSIEPTLDFGINRNLDEKNIYNIMVTYSY